MRADDWTLLLAGVGSAVVASVLTGMLLAPAVSDAPQAELDGSAVASLEQRLSQLAAEQANLESQLGQLHRASGEGRSEVGGVDAAVARWIAANAPELGAQLRAELATPVDQADLLETIIGRDFGAGGERAFWQQVAESGQLDSVLAAIEAQAADSPRDVQIQLALAETYVAKGYQTGMGPARIELSAKADAAYDRVLAVDANHWGARVGKAIELSRLPSMMGKASQAIEQFEIVVDQQEQRQPETRFADSYFYLGNLYQEAGKADKAAAAWQRGLQYFPENDRLRGQITSAEAEGSRR